MNHVQLVLKKNVFVVKMLLQLSTRLGIQLLQMAHAANENEVHKQVSCYVKQCISETVVVQQLLPEHFCSTTAPYK